MDLPGAFNRSADPAPFPVAEGERNASPGSAGALVPARSVCTKLRRFFAAFEFLSLRHFKKPANLRKYRVCGLLI